MKDIIARKSYYIGHAGENFVQGVLFKYGIASTKLGDSDFGEDFICDVFTNEDENGNRIRTNISFRLQVKTTEDITDKGYIRKISSGYAFSLDSALMKLWRENYYPTILVIWNLKNDCGYWCAPLEKIEVLNSDTTTVYFNEENELQKSIEKIKEYVRNYYDQIIKISQTKYSCTVSPIWMPSYRLFSNMELHQYFKSIQEQDTFDIIQQPIDYLPSFLTSYPNLDECGVPCLKFTEKADSLENFIDFLERNLKNNCVSSKREQWLAFIISPIEVLSEQSESNYRKIDELTQWMCLSLLDGNFFSDFDYNFKLDDNYFYSERIRAASDDEEYFVHKSGNFAVLLYTFGYALASRLMIERTHDSLAFKNFCVVDISRCTSQEKNDLSHWCSEKNLSYVELQEDQQYIIISYPLFNMLSGGLMLSGALTWEESDALNLDTESFKRNIPFGQVVDNHIKEEIIKKYAGYSCIDNRCTELGILYSQAILGEALNHLKRTICFEVYLFVKESEKTPLIDQKLINKSEQEFAAQGFNAKIGTQNFVYREQQAIDLIAYMQIPLENSTAIAVGKASVIFEQLYDAIKDNFDSRHNMAYHIKYKLDRWVPEEIII